MRKLGRWKQERESEWNHCLQVLETQSLPRVLSLTLDCGPEGISRDPYLVLLGFLCAQLVKNPRTVQETWVWSLGWEDALEQGKAPHVSILDWRIPWTVLSTRLQRVGHDWVTWCLWPSRTPVRISFIILLRQLLGLSPLWQEGEDPYRTGSG